MPDNGMAFGSITGANQDPSNTLNADIQLHRSPTEPGEIRETAPPQDRGTKSMDEGTNHSSPLLDKVSRNKGKEREAEMVSDSRGQILELRPLLFSPLQEVENIAEKTPKMEVGSSYHISPHSLGSVNKHPDTVATLLSIMQQQQAQLQADMNASMKLFMDSQAEKARQQNNELWKLVSMLLPNAKEEVEQEILHTPPQQPPTKATDTQKNVAEHATNVQVPITLEQGKVAEKTTNVQAPVEQGTTNPKSSQWGNDIVRLTTMYIYLNGRTYNEMVNDPCFVRIPGCT
ncbi:hypothetical protein GYMLUDRAFT_243137 [Collybiopsis luxurians FD-317 M1]|uniref:Uncharacterized protein n=1 Tax=Collybiopsis luxurians FD-317 M1 TaxID=944289 RepID=A0A0D0BE19_9AGAR|nr:hypothetical protein GYMLUDRAFT_243137 [Collybiopsis luxurians FD-317 M1]